MNMTEYSELLVTFLWTPGWWWFGGDRDKILSWHDLTPDLLNNQSWVRNKLIQKKPTSDECHLSPLSSICSGVILLSSQGTSRNLSIFQRQIFLKQIVFYAFIISWIWVKINISRLSHLGGMRWMRAPMMKLTMPRPMRQMYQMTAWRAWTGTSDK